MFIHHSGSLPFKTFKTKITILNQHVFDLKVTLKVIYLHFCLQAMFTWSFIKGLTLTDKFHQK